MNEYWVSGSKLALVVAMSVFGLMVVLFSGCASKSRTQYIESTWSIGADDQMYENTVKIVGKTKAGLFGEAPDGNVHNVSTKWGGGNGTPSEIKLGLSANLSNRGQVDALATSMPLLESLLNVLGLAFQQRPQVDPNNLQAIINTLNARIEALEAPQE